MTLNGVKDLFPLTSQTYKLFIVDPGTHTLGISSWPDLDFEFITEEGENYFVRLTLHDEVFSSDNKILDENIILKGTIAEGVGGAYGTIRFDFIRHSFAIEEMQELYLADFKNYKERHLNRCERIKQREEISSSELLTEECKAILE